MSPSALWRWECSIPHFTTNGGKRLQYGFSNKHNLADLLSCSSTVQEGMGQNTKLLCDSLAAPGVQQFWQGEPAHPPQHPHLDAMPVPAALVSDACKEPAADWKMELDWTESQERWWSALNLYVQLYPGPSVHVCLCLLKGMMNPGVSSQTAPKLTQSQHS